MIPVNLLGQVVPMMDQYVLNPLSINPAYAGNRGALNIAAFYRRQWVGIKGSPETMTLALDAPLFDSKLGLGLSVRNDKIGVTNENQFQSAYSFKINMDKGTLSLGLGAGIMTTNTAWSDLVVIDPGDEIYLSDSRVFIVPDFSFGIYYSYGNYFAGFSVPKLLNYKFDYARNKYTLNIDAKECCYLFNTGYIMTLSPKIKIFPTTLVSFSPGKKFSYDFNVNVNFSDRLWTGVSYRSNKSIIGLFQYSINNQLRIAYAYDFDFGKLRKYSNGSHEIMLRYELRYKIEVANPLIF